MRWIAPTPKDAAASFEKRLWDAADRFRTNSGLILDRIFLRVAKIRFT
ncbi:MAG: hypothetical protein U0172_13740 [Nitrospiraceae bacterium]